MAITLELTDGVTTYDLLASPYSVHVGTLDLGSPASLRAEASNLFRSGWDLVAHGFTRRTIRMMLRVQSADLATLAADVGNVQSALRRARLHQISGLGSRWRLKVNIGGSARDVFFTVQTGELRLPPGGMNAHLLTASNPTVLNAPLVLECDPLGEGDEETVENHCPDPSFEVAGTPLSDWTEDIGGSITATTSRDTTQAKYGTASLKIDVTGSTGVNAATRKSANFTAAASEVWSFSVWVNVTSINANAEVRIRIRWDPGAGTATTTRTTTTSGWVQLKIENQTAPGGTTGVQVQCQIASTGSGAVATAYFDGVMAIKASSVPTTWVSGRSLRNHFDDDGQAHLNYLDVHDVLGDYPARVQLKATENEAHTGFWAGARHGGTAGRQYDGGIFHEGEDFGAWTMEPTGSGSGNSYGRYRVGVAFDAGGGTGANSGSSVTHSGFTVAANGDRLLIAVVSYGRGGGAGTVSSVTWNAAAESFTKLDTNAFGNYGVDIWYLVNPTATTGDIVATWGTSHDRGLSIGVTSWYGIHQTTPLGAMASNNGASDTPSVTVASDAGDWCVEGLVADQGNGGSPVAPATGVYSFTSVTTNMAGAGSREQATGSSTIIDRTGAGGSTDWRTVGVAIKAANAGTAGSPSVVTKSVATPPRGTYRALARVESPDGANFKLGLGYAYGGVTQDPSVSSQYADIPTTTTGWHILDIGALQVPPEPLPDGATLGTLTLRLAMYRAAASAPGASDRLHVDWVLLLPVDFGSGYVTKTSGTDVVVSDSISRPPGLALWDTSDVFQTRPEQEGTPPLIDPDGTRVYLVADGGADADDGWSVSVRVVPQYISVG